MIYTKSRKTEITVRVTSARIRRVTNEIGKRASGPRRTATWKVRTRACENVKTKCVKMHRKSILATSRVPDSFRVPSFLTTDCERGGVKRGDGDLEGGKEKSALHGGSSSHPHTFEIATHTPLNGTNRNVTM